MVALVYLSDYLLDVHTRKTRLPNCQWHAVPPPESGPYSARYCWLSKQTQLLRVYGADGQLVAERMYPYSNLPQFTWTSERLWYDTNPDDSFIAMPPSIFEWVRARLP